MKTAYSFEIRLVTCDHCGAPIAVGEAGGRLDCAHCGGAQQTQAASRAVQRSASLPESERVERLRHADRGSVLPPNEVADFFVGFELLPWKMGPALAEWKFARAAASQGGDYQTQHLLQRLSVALADHFDREGDALRTRSLLEAALDATAEPVFRVLQRVRGPVRCLAGQRLRGPGTPRSRDCGARWFQSKRKRTRSPRVVAVLG